MLKGDKYLKENIRNILQNGFVDENPRPHYADGTPAHTLSINHVVQTYDLSKGELPLISLRQVAIKNAIKEILWIYQDATNSLDVLENKYNIHWWNEWESTVVPRTIGQRYGATVSKYTLMRNLLDELVNDPFGRRHIISLWQEQDFLETDGLKPCAFLTIWNVRAGKDGKKYLDMMLIQRSSDYLTAGAINQFQYICLQMMVARHCHYEPGQFTWVVANMQIYDRHIENAEILLKREEIDCNPRIILNPEKTNFYDFTIDDFKLEGYPIKEINEKNPQLKFELGI